MSVAVEFLQFFFYLMGGLGLFFSGVGILWFTSVYKDKNQNPDKTKK